MIDLFDIDLNKLPGIFFQERNSLSTAEKAKPALDLESLKTENGHFSRCKQPGFLWREIQTSLCSISSPKTSD